MLAFLFVRLLHYLVAVKDGKGGKKTWLGWFQHAHPFMYTHLLHSGSLLKEKTHKRAILIHSALVSGCYGAQAAKMGEIPGVSSYKAAPAVSIQHQTHLAIRQLASRERKTTSHCLGSDFFPPRSY